MASSMLKRVVDRRSQAAEPGILYGLTEFSSEYVSKWAPPSSETYALVQLSLKKLRELAESESMQRATYAYDPSAIHTSNNRDQLICSSYLRQAIEKAS